MTDITERLISIAHRLDELKQEQAAIQAEINELQRLGVTDATPHWRRKETKYGKAAMLELIHSTGSAYEQRTGRRREYIGTDQVKIQAVLDCVKRYGRFRSLNLDLRDKERHVYRVEKGIDQLERLAFAKQITLWD
jgi:hypothetical protein